MFGLKKKKEKERIEAREEKTGMVEYVRIDSIQAHLVDVLEENRRLKEAMKQRDETHFSDMRKKEKEKEIALIEADEWKKRAAEKENEIKKLKKEIDRQDKELEQLKNMENHLKTEAEMAKAESERVIKRQSEKEENLRWLERAVKKYMENDWKKMTKTQIIDILKTIVSENGEGKKEQ